MMGPPLPSLAWRECPSGSPAQANGFVCSTAVVPFDYRDLDGPSISLAGTAIATKAKFHALLARLRRSPITLGSGTGAVTITYKGLVTDVGNVLEVVQPFHRGIPSQSIQGWSGASAALQEIWEAGMASPTHMAAEFVLHDADATMQTMVAEPVVLHPPIDAFPPDLEVVNLSNRSTMHLSPIGDRGFTSGRTSRGQ